MERDNPYAPPSESRRTGELAPEGPGTLDLSGRGWDVVTGLTRWMRIVSVLQYIGGGLIVLVAIAALVSGGRLLAGGAVALGALGPAAVGGGLLLTALLFILGATWLRRAASHFYDGVLSDAERPLARGFRSLRLYLILYGVFNILGLVAKVAQMVAVKMVQE